MDYLDSIIDDVNSTNCEVMNINILLSTPLPIL